MKFLLPFLLIIFTLITGETISFSQTGTIKGSIKSIDGIVEFARVILLETKYTAISNKKGQYLITNIPFGSYQLKTSFIGKISTTETVTLSEQTPNLIHNIELKDDGQLLKEIVVTGTKTPKDQHNSVVKVNILNRDELNQVQACNLSEGLKFQPGLRVETDCQTCNYTQLRINGLGGGYSQILVNGRPIFSPLTGLYGLEQIPTNMIDRIEVVRGGGSSLYGSSAIGGTVNVITKVPSSNSFEVNSFYQNIYGNTNDYNLTGNSTSITKNNKAGMSIFFNLRKRNLFDYNGDNYSEMPELKNAAFGTNLFFIPKNNQKLELNISYLNEYRYGGEMVKKAAFLTQQSEERIHNALMYSSDYQINFNKGHSSFILYAAGQNTDRTHYTGIYPDSAIDIQNHIENPPYGFSNAITFQTGLQLNHKIDTFLLGSNTLTFGAEYLIDQIDDKIEAYNYVVDQTTTDLGMFFQSDWDILPSLTFLAGIRMDHHNLVDKLIFSPRTSLLYKHKKNLQIRLNYGSGFRAAQAFDTDLHIAFAGGGVSRVYLSPDLEPESSYSYSSSINYDKPFAHLIAGFTLEGFYTKLDKAFILQPVGEDQFGQVFEKQNGKGATVKGITIEGRINVDKKTQLESGFTIQKSEYETPVEYIDGLAGTKSFVRTPNKYGFATLSYTPNKKIGVYFNYVFTGKMLVPHFSGAPNQLVDEIIMSETFSELSLKLEYTIALKTLASNIQFYSGVKNILNAYQPTFDIGKNRDSNFVYGPALPRTVYFGIKLISL